MTSLFQVTFIVFLHFRESHFQGCGIRKPAYRDCQDYQENGFTQSGVYHVTPFGTYGGYKVYCDMETNNGGWLVVQRRQDGSVDFFMGWEKYQEGFGNVSGEHWLGNLPLKTISDQGHYMLRIDLEDFEGERRYAEYKVFHISDSTDKYRLALSGYTGDAGNAMKTHHGMVFSTKDDDSSVRGCVDRYRGGWWYADCHKANLNGLYLIGNTSSYADGIIWFNFRGFQYSLQKVEMKIRRR